MSVTGDKIWGAQCWWAPVEDVNDIPLDVLKEGLELYKAHIKEKIEEADASLN